jgi:hypothetical protein
MNRPSFFIAGHSKSGTTALANFLEQHPGLFMCAPKEPNYFCPSWCRADGQASIFTRRSESDYLALFEGARPDQRCGEASAVYLYSPEAAARIHDFDPDSRIIMIFREPVDFVRSYHLQLLRNPPAEGERIKDLAEAIRLEPARRRGEALPEGCLVPEFLYYTTDRLRYDEHYDRFAALFPPQQILTLLYDDFRRDNAGTVRRVYEFLGVDPDFEPELGDHNAGGVALRSRHAQAMMRRATHGGGLVAAARAALPTKLRRRAADVAYRRVVFGEAEAVDPALAREIRARAHPHVIELGKRLGRDLVAKWGYAEQAEPVLSTAT